jgi:hypothetical protein
MAYYMGDYYQGDPGPLGALAGGLVLRGAKPLAKKVGGLIGKVLRKPATGPAVGSAATGVLVTRAATQQPPPGYRPKPGLRGLLERITPGGKTGYVRTRRMNPANPKALRRALRRIAGFGKLAQRARRDVSRAATAIGVRRRTQGRKRR